MLIIALLGCTRPDTPAAPEPEAASPLQAPWIASGDVTTTSAIIWARAMEGDRLSVRAGEQTVGPVKTGPLGTGKLKLTGLPAGSEVRYTVSACDADGACGEASGSLQTAPEAPAPLRLIVGGDLGGQGHCRAVDGGYRIFDALAALEPHLFIANGDMIYADGRCTDTSPAGVPTVPATFHAITDRVVDWSAAADTLDAHWAYNHADPGLQRFLSKTPMISQWDDHEVVNDFGASWPAWLTGDESRPGFVQLVEQGRAAFLRWSPVDGARIERRFAWGPEVDLFIVDARSHRSNNRAPDGPEKTLLGVEQKQRLIAGLTTSQAIWKVVSIDVPISTPTGSRAWEAGRDGWANGIGADAPEGMVDTSTTTGFEHELTEILTALDVAGVTGLVFVTTDVHHVRSLRYSVDLDDNGAPLVFHEFISGPLSAWTGDPPPLDPTFGPEVLYESSHTFNAALLSIIPGEGLTASIIDADGVTTEASVVRIPTP